MRRRVAPLHGKKRAGGSLKLEIREVADQLVEASKVEGRELRVESLRVES